MKPVICAIFLCGVSACALLGGSITLGGNVTGNSFPFGGPVTGFPGTRFQEAYASGDFSGPITITGIDFFRDATSGGDLYAGTYQLSLSIVTTGIDNLSDTNFDGNLGPDNAVFETVALSGAPPSTLSFTGGPFYYDPAEGNLLLDVQISNGVAPSGPATAMFEDGDSFGPAGVIRYSNFGGGTGGFGLVTEFDFPTPEPGTLALLGCGLVGLSLLRLRRSR
jgi:PEP-CTERM motif